MKYPIENRFDTIGKIDDTNHNPVPGWHLAAYQPSAFFIVKPQNLSKAKPANFSRCCPKDFEGGQKKPQIGGQWRRLPALPPYLLTRFT